MKQLQAVLRYRVDHAVHHETSVSVQYGVAVGDPCPGDVGVVHRGGDAPPPRTLRDYCPVCLAFLELQLVDEVSVTVSWGDGVAVALVAPFRVRRRTLDADITGWVDCPHP